MKTVFRLALAAVAAAFVALGAVSFLVTGALLRDWDVWPYLGHSVWVVAHLDHAVWILPVTGLLLIRAGLFFFELQTDMT